MIMVIRFCRMMRSTDPPFLNNNDSFKLSCMLNSCLQSYTHWQHGIKQMCNHSCSLSNSLFSCHKISYTVTCNEQWQEKRECDVVGSLWNAHAQPTSGVRSMTLVSSFLKLPILWVKSKGWDYVDVQARLSLCCSPIWYLFYMDWLELKTELIVADRFFKIFLSKAMFNF